MDDKENYGYCDKKKSFWESLLLACINRNKTKTKVGAVQHWVLLR